MSSNNDDKNSENINNNENINNEKDIIEKNNIKISDDNIKEDKEENLINSIEEEYSADIDEIIKKLYPFENKQMSQNSKNEQIKLVTENKLLSEDELKYLCIKSMEIFMQESSFLELTAPIIICGDIHGQYRDLIRLFDFGGSPQKKQYLFLGDYVDRGKNSIECIALLLAYKVKYPKNIFLLRGNHESANINRMYGFYDECKRKVSLRIYKKFCNLFNILPITALVGEKILCMHGGLAYDLKNLDQLKTIKRPTEIPEAGLLCDLVWSDPDESLYFDFCTNKERGISVCFSKKKVEEFTKENDLDLICRAHQVVEEGFQFFANMKLITVFTAPNYMEEFDNNGGILEVNEDMICSLHVLKPDKSNISKKRWKKISRFIN